MEFAWKFPSHRIFFLDFSPAKQVFLEFFFHFYSQDSQGHFHLFFLLFLFSLEFPQVDFKVASRLDILGIWGARQGRTIVSQILFSPPNSHFHSEQSARFSPHFCAFFFRTIRVQDPLKISLVSRTHKNENNQKQ